MVNRCDYSRLYSACSCHQENIVIEHFKSDSFSGENLKRDISLGFDPLALLRNSRHTAELRLQDGGWETVRYLLAH